MSLQKNFISLHNPFKNPLPPKMLVYHCDPFEQNALIPSPLCSGSSPLAGKSSLLGRASHAGLVSFRSLNMLLFSLFRIRGIPVKLGSPGSRSNSSKILKMIEIKLNNTFQKIVKLLPRYSRCEPITVTLLK
jgi:hypothetical protein